MNKKTFKILKLKKIKIQTNFKNFLIKPIILLSVIFSLFAYLYSKEQNITFKHISLEHGLSQSSINCILQDSKEFMWFGTQDGLNKYDGYIFTFYKHELQNQNSLSHNFIFCIHEDQDGILWIGTNGGGLNKFDPNKGQWTRFTQNKQDSNSLSDNFVRSIYKAPTEPGILWIGTDRGLNKFNRIEEKFITYYKHEPDDPNTLSNNSVRAIFEDKSGVFWVGTNGGLDKFDRKEEKFVHYKHDPKNPNSLSNDSVRAIYEEEAGIFWVGTKEGLNKFDRKEEKFTHYKHDPKNPNSICDSSIMLIYEAPTEPGALWFGTDGGGVSLLYRGNNREEKILNYRHDPKDLASLSNNMVSSIYESKDGILWIGTTGGSLNVYDRRKEKFVHYKNNPNDPNSLSSNIVISIYEDIDGKLWLGTAGGGLNIYDRKKEKFALFKNDPNDPNSLGSNIINLIYKDNKKKLWIGTYESGFCQFFRDRQGKEKFIHYKHDPDNPNSLSNNSVWSISEDQSGIFWIGTEEGLNKYDRKKRKFSHYKHDPNDPNTLSNNLIRVLYEAPTEPDVLWIGTDGGLNKFDRNKEEFTHYRHESKNPNSLSNNLIFSIYESQSGTLWIGTNGGGLNQFDRVKEQFTHFTEKDGLPNNVIYGILEDNNGNLWLSTNMGLSQFNPKIKECKNYDIHDGLQSNEFNRNAYFRSRKGEMFFGGINGFNSFYPDKIKQDTLVNPIVITDFQISNKSVPIGKRTDGRTILKKSIAETKNIVLSYRDNVISFEYLALNYSSPEKNEYAYMMEGFEKKWNYVRKRRFASYTNLPSGDYIFRVKSSNSDGVWNEKGISLKIKVTPPFWQTWWFRIFAVLFVLFLIFSLYSFRMRKIKARKKQLEKLVTERTRDLKSKTAELEKINNIVKSINKEVNDIDILNSILKETTILKGFDRSSALVYDKSLDAYRFKATLGYKDHALDNIQFSIQEVNNRYIKEAKEIYKDIFIIKNIEERIEEEIIKKLGIPKSLLIIKIQIKDLVAGLLIFESMKDKNAFETQDLQLLINLKDHIASALIKSKLLLELSAEREIAETASKSKTMFLARMSHEIRTPMNSVIGFADMLLDTEQDEEQIEYTRNITKSGETLLTLINEILDFSKIEAGQLTIQYIDFDLEVTAFDVCHLIQPRLGNKPVEIICRIGDQIPAYIMSDPGRIRQVLLNLMANAAKFTNKGEIELYMNIEDEEEDRLKLHVTVRDTGIGIAKNKLLTIFEVFQQADGSTTRRYGGTGLGLAICKQIANLLEGDIYVESEVNKGSTFHFTAWLNKSKKKLIKKPPMEILSGKKILIVDDNQNNLNVLSHILKRVQMRIVTLTEAKKVFPTIQEAIQKGDLFDICILDIQMPDISGYEVAKQIHNSPDPSISKLPLLAFSSSTTKRTKVYRESGFDGFLPKPIQRHKLLAMIKRLLGEEIEQEDRRKKKTVITQHSLVEEAKHSICILLVEDNPLNQKLAKYMLLKAGYQLEVANDGKEAVVKYTTDPERFDLIFMDINMPEMDGIEATRIIRNRGYADIPIIAITADVLEEDRKKCIKAGMNDYIAKPIKREVVYNMVRKWVFNPEKK